MKSVDLGIYPQSSCFAFSPSPLQKSLCFYPTWCGHYYCSDRYFMRRKSYQYLLVIYIRKGELHVELEDTTFDAHKGDVVLLDCTKPHYYHAREGLEFVYLHFEGSNAFDICHHIIEKRGSLIQDECCTSIGRQIFEMIQFYARNGIESVFETSLRVYQIIEQLTSTQKPGYHMENPIEKSIQYILAHIAEPLSIADLARVANLSPYYFSHSFKKQTGFSPMDYVINTRISRAKEMLLLTTLPISEIAFKVGYSNSGSLINLFVQRVGISPKNYRKSHQPQTI